MCVTLKIPSLNSFLWQIGLGQSEPEHESFNVLIHGKQFQVKKKNYFFKGKENYGQKNVFRNANGNLAFYVSACFLQLG